MATALTTETLLFPWNAAYSVGIVQIDAQHQGLIRLINELHACMAAGQAKQHLGKILDDLVRYTESHFSYEENMLRQRGYTRFTAHHAIHQKLTGEVKELRDRHRGSQLTLTLDVMKFLKSWLADHIIVHDQAYAHELMTK